MKLEVDRIAVVIDVACMTYLYSLKPCVSCCQCLIMIMILCIGVVVLHWTNNQQVAGLTSWALLAQQP